MGAQEHVPRLLELFDRQGEATRQLPQRVRRARIFATGGDAQEERRPSPMLAFLGVAAAVALKCYRQTVD